jgi:hypothetical protein
MKNFSVLISLFQPKSLDFCLLIISSRRINLSNYTKYENLHIWLIKRAKCRIHNERNENFIEHENGWILKI